MKKLICTILTAVLLIFACFENANAQSQRYVRKKPQPNFFIPQGALAESQTEKVRMPQYGQGRTTAKHISADDNREAEMLAARQRRFKNQKTKAKQPAIMENQQAEPEETTPITAAAETPVQTARPAAAQTAAPTAAAHDDSVPDYQQKYQEYLKDLETIAKTGKVTANPGVAADLSAMNSEQRIEIDKKFNADRDVKSEVEKLLR